LHPSSARINLDALIFLEFSLTRSATIVLAAFALLILVIIGFSYEGEGPESQTTDPSSTQDDSMGSDDATSAPGAEMAEASVVEAMTAPDGVLARVTPTFDVVRVNRQGEAVLAGRAAPNSIVTIFNHNQKIGQVTTDARGEWVWIPEEPFVPGDLELSLSARIPGGEDVLSDEIVVMILPEAEHDIAGRLSDGASNPLILKKRRGGAGPSELMQSPGGVGGDVSLSLDVVDYDEKGRLQLSGRSLPKAVVRVYLDNALIGDATTDAAGRWSMTPGKAVAPGLYSLRLDHVGPDGKVVSRIELPFTRAEITEEMNWEDRVVVQPGNSLWRLARHVYGSGFEYSVIYEANSEQIRNPDLIYPGQIFALPLPQTKQP
jgi:hypothetical protein